MDPVDQILEHYGVKGMKWGVHRSHPNEIPTSSDAASAKTYHQTVKKHGTDALSNDELQKLITRLNLEKQLKSLPFGPSEKGKKVVADLLLNIGKQQTSKTINDQVTKTITKKLAEAALRS